MDTGLPKALASLVRFGIHLSWDCPGLSDSRAYQRLPCLPFLPLIQSQYLLVLLALLRMQLEEVSMSLQSSTYAKKDPTPISNGLRLVPGSKPVV